MAVVLTLPGKAKPLRLSRSMVKVPPRKTAPSSSSPMSKAPDLTHAEVSILAKMATLDENTPRYRVLESALAFKSSWVILGEHLAEVLRTSSWKAWGYASFERYCSDEVHTSPATAKKLVRSWSWLGEEAPEYLPPRDRAELQLRVDEDRMPEGALPDLNAVSVLADAKKAFDESRVSEDAYMALKRAALDGEAASALKKALTQSLPAAERPKKADDRVRHLRRALTAVVKVLDELREWDAGGESVAEDLMVQAEQLRDAIALRLPKEA